MTAPLERARRALRYAKWAAIGLRSEPRLLSEMWQFERDLPKRVAAQPLPELMAGLTPQERDLRVSFPVIRAYADTVAGFDVTSPLGICLRRSLVRYYFLRRAGLPVQVRFGARFKESKDIGGHAWLVLNDAPYYEASENYRGFAVMFSYP